MLILTMLIVGRATFLLGLLPTYQSIGIWAPILLVTLLIFQGIGLGGEYGGAALATIEHSPRNNQGYTTARGWCDLFMASLQGSCGQS